MAVGAYHSVYNEASEKGKPVPDPKRRYISNIPILPLRSTGKFKGNAPPLASGEDIIDEAIRLFKANILFRNYEMRGFADRLFVYITLYINACLNKIVHKSKGEAERILYAFAIEPFSMPGNSTFCLGGLCPAPANKGDEDFLRTYLTFIRQETYTRLLDVVYCTGDAEPNKWWMCFQKRKFLNKTL